MTGNVPISCKKNSFVRIENGSQPVISIESGHSYLMYALKGTFI